MGEKNISITNNLEQAEILSRFVEEVAEEWGLPGKIILNLVLVVEEVVANIIFYGYDDRAEHRINLGFSYEDNTITLQVEDDGRAFNPLLAAPADTTAELHDCKVGGLGLYLVRKIMDEITYSRLNNKNILILKKHIT